jgi:hypothetical protein
LEVHPVIALAPDVYWIIEYFETYTGFSLEGRIPPELILKWVRQNRFAGFQLHPEQITALVPQGELVPVRDFLGSLFDLYAHARGKQVVGTESPRLMRRLPTARALWPSVKVVHLIRDGRDVCFSLLECDGPDVGPAKERATWEVDRVSTIALWWREKVRQGRKAGRTFGSEHYHELHYETLVAKPSQASTALSAFLGLPSDAIARSPNAVVAERAKKNGQLAGGDMERWEAASGDLLDELGYQRFVPRPGSKVLRRAKELKEAFANSRHDGRTSPRVLQKRRQERAWANPFVFIVGCPRSGTTLLQRLLNAHPDVAVPPESFWVPYFFKKRIGMTDGGVVSPELVSRLFAYYKFYRMKLAPVDLTKVIEAESPLTYAQFVSRVFDLHAEGQGKSLAGDKTPDYIRNIPLLHELWPKAKFIHLIRDGRDVCLSAIAWKRKVDKLASLFPTWQEDPATTASLWWEWHVRQGCQQGCILGTELYYEMRYESLVAEPAKECAKLCAFLGLPYEDSMLQFNEGRTRMETDLDAKNAWLPITAGLRDWQKEMSSEYVERSEAAVGALLAELGYPASSSRPSAEVVAQVDRVRQIFGENTRCLGDWLP